MLQASFADDDAAARRDYLAEEIERNVREIPASRRKAHLEALAERFPEWGVASGAEEEEVVEPEPAPAAGPSPATLASQLVELAATLSEAEREDITNQLLSVGLAARVSSGATTQESDEVRPELQKKLGLDASQALDRKRAIRLVAVLIDLVVTMVSRLNVWKNLAPNSRVRRDPGPTGDLRKLAVFITGDPEVSTAQVTQLLDKTRQLIAGLLAAVGATGEAFARQYISPVFHRAASRKPPMPSPDFLSVPSRSAGANIPSCSMR